MSIETSYCNHNFYSNTMSNLTTFDIACKKLIILGIGRNLFFFQKIKILFPLIFGFICFCIYFLHGADTFEERINTVFISSMIFIAILAVSYCIWNTDKVQRILEDAENIVDSSEYGNLFYDEQIFLVFLDIDITTNSVSSSKSFVRDSWKEPTVFAEVSIFGAISFTKYAANFLTERIWCQLFAGQ